MEGILSLQCFSGISYTSQSDWFFFSGQGWRVNLCQALPLSSSHGDMAGICAHNGAEERGHSLGCDETETMRQISFLVFACSCHLSAGRIRFQTPLIEYQRDYQIIHTHYFFIHPSLPCFHFLILHFPSHPFSQSFASIWVRLLCDAGFWDVSSPFYHSIGPYLYCHSIL